MVAVFHVRTQGPRLFESGPSLAVIKVPISACNKVTEKEISKKKLASLTYNNKRKYQRYYNNGMGHLNQNKPVTEKHKHF